MSAIDDHEVAQPGFIYLKCPDCGFDCVQTADYAGSHECPLCWIDSHHAVHMRRRTALASDRPEGVDRRKPDAKPKGYGA